jgi:hypothetical protein
VLVGFHPDETLFFINTLPTQQFCWCRSIKWKWSSCKTAIETDLRVDQLHCMAAQSLPMVRFVHSV